MTEVFKLENKIKLMIDDLKGLCHTNGLANQAAEEEVITSVFLYKFLNDKFMYNLGQFAKEIGETKEEVLANENDELDAFYNAYSQDVAFTYNETIEYLINKTSYNEFYKLFDDALENISKDEKNEIFSIETDGGERKPLFNRITEVVEVAKRNNFAVSIFGIISQEKFDFSNAFNTNFDFYSTIFEYLISDYNVASGVYAEYFTPQSISSINAKILAHMSPLDKDLYEIYDPSAGSGSLILHLANELGEGKFGERAVVYTQDISNKSTRFLRLNLLLNGLTRSLKNVIQGDTLLNPSHYQVEGDESSGLKQFDFVTSNPPFKTDFSKTRDDIEQKWEDSELRNGNRRFFAGIPNVKEKMEIYLMFIQHILYSLKDDGKAAIVVPAGFITAQKGIEKKLRKEIIDKHWLKGVISMPSNIFANTGTNVSVLYIDKSNQDGKVLLMDASNLGEKVKDGQNQKTVLNKDEENLIVNTFVNQTVVDNLSVLVSYEEISEKNYSLKAGQYFELKIKNVELTNEEFNCKINECMTSINNYKNENSQLYDEILKEIGDMTYGK